MAFKAGLLRKKLKEAGKSQKFLAEKIRKTERTVSRWLNGGNAPKAKDLERIAEALNCQPEEFDPNYANTDMTVAMHAFVSHASHNVYEIMRMRYGVSHKEIIELAPVLFSIVAASALNIPAADDALMAKATRLGLTVSNVKNHADANGRILDERASREYECFGIKAEDPFNENPRNLFYETIKRLCLNIDHSIDMRFSPEPEAGEVFSAVGFLPEKKLIDTLTGGDEKLIAALATGRIHLSKFLKKYKEAGGTTPEGVADFLREALSENTLEDARKREESLVKLQVWQAFYHERFPEYAQEYDMIVQTYCHEAGWVRENRSDRVKEECRLDPYQEHRFINPSRLPDYQKHMSTGNILFYWTDPVHLRLKELEKHRREIKKKFEELSQ